MIASDHLSADREERLHEVLLAYLEADAQGQAPDLERFLEEHAEFAGELADFFAGRRRVESIVAPLRALAAHPEDLRGSRIEDRGSTERDPSGTGIPARVGSGTGIPARVASAGQECPAHSPGGTGIPARAASAGQECPAHTRSSILDPRSSAPFPCGQLGDFRLCREIGRGGMGIVYEAEQASLNRRVAVKVLPFAGGLDPKQLLRFKNEAQTAALLHHPNIVPVFAVGCDKGVHYFAMQLIEGQSLADLIAECREAGQAGKPDLRRSSAADRDARLADLGRRAARALEYAHQQGVVHRDIKPANLLLDARDQLWITDFGLAVFQTGPGVTITGELVGTLRYMSPEQALARRNLVDHRTDIYSLGVTLCELLTLRPVFPGQDGVELLYQIAHQEPLPPRAVDRTIAVDLETILLKAMAKNPAERYGSAGELADDLQRFLEHQPIRARRPTLLDRTAKWARRHRTVVACGLAAFLLLVGCLTFSHCLLHRTHARVKAALAGEQQKSKEAEEQRARAEANFRQARRAVDLFVELSDEEMFDKPQMLEMRMKLLEAALMYYQDFIAQHGDEPSMQAELEEARRRAARLLQEIYAIKDANNLKLLTHPAVQKDLALTDSQRARVARGETPSPARSARDRVGSLPQIGIPRFQPLPGPRR